MTKTTTTMDMTTISVNTTVSIPQLLAELPMEMLAKAIEDRLTETELVVIGVGEDLNEHHKQYLRDLLGVCECQCHCDDIDDDEEEDEEDEEDECEEVITTPLTTYGDEEEDIYYEDDTDKEMTAEQLLSAIAKLLRK